MKLLLSLAALTVTWTAWAQGTSEAILGYAGSISGYADQTVGWTFQTTNAFTVTDLGCFAKVFSDNPTVTSVQVGLWDDTGVLVASNSVTLASLLFNQTRYQPITQTRFDPGTYHLGVYAGGGISFDVAGPSTGGSVFASPGFQVTGVAIAARGGFSFPSTAPGTAGSIHAGPNFRFLDESKNTAPATNLVHGIPYTNTLPAFSLQYFTVQVPLWANRATNVVEFADQVQTSNSLPYAVFFNQTNFPTLTDRVLLHVGADTAILTTNGTPPLVPGKTYYLAFTNPNPVAVTFGIGVWFDITTLTNCELLDSNVAGVAGMQRYFQFDPPTGATNVPQPVSFWLTGVPCGLQVVLSQHLPLPDLSQFDYISQGPCTNDLIVMYVANSIPGARWYVGVFNSNPTNATFSIQACTAPVPMIIPLTNGIPFVVASPTNTYAAPPGPPQRLCFDLLITNSVPGALFELYNLSGNADLVLQHDVPPMMPPYFGASSFTGTTPEQIVLRTNSGLHASYYLPDLRGHWYLGLVNNESTNVAYTIRAILPDTNGLLVSGRPLLVSITPPAPPRGLVLSWSSVVGERYLVQSTPSLAAPAVWTPVASIVATNPLTTFEVLPAPAGTTFYRVVQSAASELPRLSILYSTNNQVRISWSTTYSGYTLQSETGLSGTWANAGQGNVVGSEYVAFETIGPGSKYYRLIK